MPPMDVAWCWHCHRLAPVEYAVNGRCPDPPPGSAFIFAKPEDVSNVETLMYGTYEPAFVSFPDTPVPHSNLQNKYKYVNPRRKFRDLELTLRYWMKLYPDEAFSPEYMNEWTNTKRNSKDSVATKNSSDAIVRGYDVGKACER